MKHKINQEYALSPNLKSKVISSLKSNNMIQNNPIPKMSIILAALALVLTFSLGFISNHFFNSPIHDLAMNNPQSKYMLLLQNTPEFKEDPSHVAEYGQWMQDLVTQGIHASGDELDINGTILGGNQTHASGINTISGYFMIETESESKAIEIANACPHIKHGGKVVVKKVISH